MHFIASLLILLCGLLLPHIAQSAALERGVAITDPYALRELENGRFGLRRMVEPANAADGPITNDALFALAPLLPVHKAIDGEFERYITKHSSGPRNETVGVGPSFDLQLFDRALLYSRDTRFVLAGIVNRMDRAYVAPDSCGEIRLIYRLTRNAVAEAGEGTVSPRLPMTLNIVLKARRGDASAIPCASIAQRWLAAGQSQLSGAELANWLVSKGGPLDLIKPENIDRIETNLQIAHAPKSSVRDFRTDYLLKVFRYDRDGRVFAESPMENQIDRARLLADDGLKREFRAWLLDPVNLVAFDRGTALIPEKFLANGAIAPTPIGFDPSDLEPEFGLVQGEGAVFSEADVVAALGKAVEGGVKLQNIRSPAGFERRLNDVTCSGCHQTRGIGGFHFPGVDWMAEKPSNTTVVPASPHFFGDQIRRRDILASLRDGKPPDYSRGFASRPQLRGSTELDGTNYYDGWGAHCYVQGKPAASNDGSFRDWTCAEGLTCQAAGKISRIGMCFVKSR